MKKILLIVLSLSVLLCSCVSPLEIGDTESTGTAENNPLSSYDEPTDTTENTQDNEVKYSSMSADWPMYSNSQELIDSANVVYIGKVTDISFHVLDATNATPATDATPVRHRELYTIYDVEITQSYKGENSGTSKIRIMGGLENYKVDQQVQLMVQKDIYDKDFGIPIWGDTNKTKCEIGQTYLFVLYQFETGLPTILNLEQSVFGLDDPTKKQTIGNNDKDYYSGDVDEFGKPLISVKDILTTFGQDKWDEFYKQWESSK